MDLLGWLRSEWDRAGAWLAIAVGVLALILGYVGVSATEFTAEQLPYIVSGGLVGIFLLGIGGMLWLSADLRDEWRKLDAMDAKLDLLEAHGLAAVAGPCRGVAGETGAGPQHPGGPRVTVEVAASRRRLAVGTGPRSATPIIPGAPWRLSDLVTLIGSVTVGAVLARSVTSTG